MLCSRPLRTCVSWTIPAVGGGCWALAAQWIVCCCFCYRVLPTVTAHLTSCPAPSCMFSLCHRAPGGGVGPQERVANH